MDNIQCEKGDQNQHMLVNVVPSQILRFDMVCRVCGNENEKNIQIFGTDGQNYELALKMNTYLPIKVTDDGRLPSGCCWTCASTILSWHDLVVTSIETDRKIKELQIVLTKPLITHLERTEGESESVLNHSKKTTNNKDDSLVPNEIELNINQLVDSTISTSSETSYQFHQTEDICNKFKFNNNQASSNVNLKADSFGKITYFDCHLCNNKYFRKFDLKKHIRLKHPISKPETDKPDGKRTNLTKYKVTINGKVFYQCDLCENRYQQGYNLTRHKFKHSNGPKSHICHVCGKIYSSKSGLKRHHNESHTTKRYVCKICNEQFRAKVTLIQHINIHTDTRPFVCDICGKRFRQESSLRIHKMYHSNANFRFKCNVCEKKYRRNCELKVHMTVHTGLKAYICKICGKSFRLSSTLKKHIKLHDRLNTCSCDVCGAHFSQLRYLNNHKKIHS